MGGSVRKVYFGWWMVVLTGLVLTLAFGATYTTFGLFVTPVAAEFGLSRADTNTAVILLTIGTALVAPGLGRLLDRFPARPIMIGSAILFGGSLAALGLSRSLWLDAVILAVLLPIGLLGSGSMTMMVLLARWFTRQRGRAIALASLGLPFGSILVAPVVGALITAVGWRLALVATGGASLLLLLAVAFIVRDRPGPGEVEGGAPTQSPGSTADAPIGKPAKVGVLLGKPQLWTIGLSAATAMGTCQALTISFAPLALSNGLSLVQAASLISVMGGGATAGMLLLAAIADRLNRVDLLTGVFLFIAVLNAALVVSTSFPALMACGVLVGLLSGAVTPVFFALLADRFGVASFGTVRGLVAPVTSVVGAVAVRFAGEVFDHTGGYVAMFYAFTVVMLLAAAAMFVTRFVGRAAPTNAPLPTPN